MLSLGTIRPGRTIYIPFDTFAGSTGAPITMTGLATSDIQVYKNGSTTQRASASGFTLLDTDGIDFDGITGIHGLSIDLSDNTTAGFWEAGATYFVVISTVTVDSQTMSFLAATFHIGYPDAILNTTIATLSSQTSFTLTAGPAEDDALNGSVLVIHDVASAVQWAQPIVLDYTGSTKTVTLAAAPTFTIAASDNVSVIPRGNVYAVNGTPASAAGTVDANVVSMAANTMTASALAADAVTEIQSGLATAAALTTVDDFLDTEITEILDRLGFLLARSAGAVSNAQVSNPSYAITRSGNTFTVALAGVTSAGVRTAPTLTKT